MATLSLDTRRPETVRRLIAVALVLAATAALALIVLTRPMQKSGGTAHMAETGALAARPPSPVPAVEPLELDASNPDEARKLNAAIPFSTAPNPAAKPSVSIGDSTALSRATDCLAAAMIYEAGDDPTGERAVGQVVLNRLRHPRLPKTVCGVVFQGQARATGCQFTFSATAPWRASRTASPGRARACWPAACLPATSTSRSAIRRIIIRTGSYPSGAPPSTR